MVTNKMNGQVALKKSFQVGGTIHISGPDFKGKVARGERVMIEEDHVEFSLRVENSDKEKIGEATPWFSMEDADVEIAAHDTEDFGPETDRLNVSFKGAAGRSFSFLINSAQARALNEILTNFVHACDSWEALKKVYPVSAAD
jgi:hypothetical protein